MRLHVRVVTCVLASVIGMPGIAAGGGKACAEPGADRPYPLMVGDAAPALKVSRWFDRGPAPRVAEGKPYVVEFWATWCIPCINGIPHLTTLQRKYKDKATIVGVAVWEPDPRETEQYISGQGDRMRYLVALDEVPPMPAGQNPKTWAYEHGVMSLSWMKASGMTGIPLAFIVDSSGTIAWIGEPAQMDGPLAEVVEGRWDLAAAKERHRQRMSAEAKSTPIIARLEKSLEAKDNAGALAAADELLALGPTMARFAGVKFQALLDAGDPAKAYAYAREAIAGVARDDKSALNTIAYSILKQPKGDRRDLDVALAAAERSDRLTEGKNSRTVKMLAEVYAARGDFAKAAEVQRRAVAVAYPEEKPEFEGLLAKYEKKGAAR